MKIFFITLLVFVDCKNIGNQTSIDLLTIKEWNKISEKIKPELKSIRYSKFLEPNGGKSYEQDDTTYFIEVLQDMKTNKRIIDYTESIYIDNIRFNKSFRFFLTSDRKIILITTEKSNHNSEISNAGHDIKDTILVDKNNIKFWKSNPTPTYKELKKKEKEISKVKNAIAEYTN